MFRPNTSTALATLKAPGSNLTPKPAYPYGPHVKPFNPIAPQSTQNPQLPSLGYMHFEEGGEVPERWGMPEPEMEHGGDALQSWLAQRNHGSPGAGTSGGLLTRPIAPVATGGWAIPQIPAFHFQGGGRVPGGVEVTGGTPVGQVGDMRFTGDAAVPLNRMAHYFNTHPQSHINSGLIRYNSGGHPIVKPSGYGGTGGVGSSLPAVASGVPPGQVIVGDTVPVAPPPAGELAGAIIAGDNTGTGISPEPTPIPGASGAFGGATAGADTGVVGTGTGVPAGQVIVGDTIPDQQPSNTPATSGKIPGGGGGGSAIGGGGAGIGGGGAVSGTGAPAGTVSIPGFGSATVGGGPSGQTASSVGASNTGIMPQVSGMGGLSSAGSNIGGAPSDTLGGDIMGGNQSVGPFSTLKMKAGGGMVGQAGDEMDSASFMKLLQQNPHLLSYFAGQVPLIMGNPMFRGGKVPGVDMGKDSVVSEVEPGELIFNKKQQAGIKISKPELLRADQIKAIKEANAHYARA